MFFSIIIKKWEKRVRKSKSHVDDFMIRLFRVSGIWIIFTVLLNIFSALLQEDAHTVDAIQKLSKILLILAIGWLVIQTVKASFHNWCNKYDVHNPDNLEARKQLTKMSMIERIVIGFAAQRSFGQIFSGIQIEFTQPIRLDNVVVIEGEWGRVEEINNYPGSFAKINSKQGRKEPAADSEK